MKIIGSFFLFLITNAVLAENLCVIHENSQIALDDFQYVLKTEGFSFSENIKRQFIIYYDTPELHFLNSGLSLNYVGEGYRSKKNKQKFHENIIFTGDTKKDYFSVKHYNNIESFEEKHPLLVLVKRKERHQFIRGLQEVGVRYPMRLKEIFKVSDIIRSISIEYKGEEVGFFDVHEMLLSRYKQEIVKTLIDFKINNDNFGKIPDIKQLVILSYVDRKIRCNGNTMYNTLFFQLESNISYFRFFLKYPYLTNLIYSIIFAFIGVLTLKALFWRRMWSSYD